MFPFLIFAMAAIKGTIDPEPSWFMRSECLMMIYQEKIAPPLAPLTHEDEMKSILESIVSEDRWVRNFIARLAGVTPDVKR